MFKLILFLKDYSQKINNYDPLDDMMQLEIDLLITDDIIAEHNSLFNFNTKLDLNSGQKIIDINQTINIQRTFTEKPFVNFSAYFLTDTSGIINSKYF